MARKSADLDRSEGRLLWIAAALVSASCAGAADPEGATMSPRVETEVVVRALLEAVDAGDVSGVKSLLAPGFRMRSWEGESLATRSEYLTMLGWDLAAGGVRTIEALEVHGDTVSLEMRERNDFTRLLGLDPFQLEVRYVVAERLIAEQRLREVPEEGPSDTGRFDQAVTPILEWGREEAPGLLDAIVVDGSIRYDERSGRALLELIRLYQSSRD